MLTMPDLSRPVKRLSVPSATGWGGMPGVAWWRVREPAGGHHVAEPTHIFDLCRYLVDSEVIVVHGLTAQGSIRDVADYDVDDMSVVNISFANGMVANIASACMLK